MSSAQNPADQIDLLRSVTDYAADYLARSTTRPVSVAASTEELRAALGGPLPAAGRDAASTLRALIDAGEPGLMSSTSGRFFGFVMGGAYPVAVATEWLMSVWDQLRGAVRHQPHGLGRRGGERRLAAPAVRAPRVDGEISLPDNGPSLYPIWMDAPPGSPQTS